MDNIHIMFEFLGYIFFFGSIITVLGYFIFFKWTKKDKYYDKNAKIHCEQLVQSLNAMNNLVDALNKLKESNPEQRKTFDERIDELKEKKNINV